MDVVRRVWKRIPSTPALPLKDTPTTGTKKKSLTSRLAFFRRPLRLRKNSNLSMPLGIVLLFPCIVVILILVLFVRHPQSPAARMIMPAGTPPAIRYGTKSRLVYNFREKLTKTQENQRTVRQSVCDWMCGPKRPTNA
jgi:hypothetical protein